LILGLHEKSGVSSSTQNCSDNVDKVCCFSSSFIMQIES